MGVLSNLFEPPPPLSQDLNGRFSTHPPPPLTLISYLNVWIRHCIRHVSYHSVEKQRDSRSQLKKGFIFEGTLITDILSLDLQHYSCRKHVCAPFRK